MFCENRHPAATMCEIFLTPDAIYFVTELQDLGHNVSIQKKFFFGGCRGSDMFIRRNGNKSHFCDFCD